MWKAIKNFFNSTNLSSEDQDSNHNVDLFGPASTFDDTSLEELFAKNFNAGGGHFLYCADIEEALHNLKQIAEFEKIESIICLDKELQNNVDTINISQSANPSDQKQNFSLLKCEYLCAFDGSIMISAHQTGGRKIEEFPLNFIIWANANQFANNLSDALQKLRSIKKDNLPSNITCIRGKDMHSFSSIPNAKNIYLLLVDN